MEDTRVTMFLSHIRQYGRFSAIGKKDIADSNVFMLDRTFEFANFKRVPSGVVLRFPDGDANVKGRAVWELPNEFDPSAVAADTDHVYFVINSCTSGGHNSLDDLCVPEHVEVVAQGCRSVGTSGWSNMVSYLVVRLPMDTMEFTYSSAHGRRSTIVNIYREFDDGELAWYVRRMTIIGYHAVESFSRELARGARPY